MTVELRPLGVSCNLQCQYCYQNPQRDAGNLNDRYDVELMKAAILAEGGPFSLFGGEALLVPERDLEEIWAWGLQQFGRNSVQTNGTLVNDEHIRMFKRYKVNVGISMDGPGALNDARWHGSVEKTRRATARSEAAIERLCAEGIAPSIILTLHRGNATEEQLPVLLDWVRGLECLGVRSMRLHLLEVESPAVQLKYALSVEQNVAALMRFANLEQELCSLRLDLFTDMRNMLLGRDQRATCVWTGCDPYTTSAVRGVEGHGQRSNCGRTNKDGIDFVKADSPGFERYVALYHTPQEHGGCNGCRFFMMCKGQCPGTALDGDWRNRTEHCEVWKAVFGRLEGELAEQGRVPLSLSPLRESLERKMIELWSAGESASIAGVLAQTGHMSTRAGATRSPWQLRLDLLRRQLQAGDRDERNTTARR